MPLYFFDTSALVKRYHVETGSEKVDEIFNDPADTLPSSNILSAAINPKNAVDLK